MIRNSILAGVGGQGLLSIAAVLGEAVRRQGLHLKQAEVHGMAQRGGGVQSHIRYGDEPIHSDLVREGTADLILSLEPMETLRYLPFLSPDGAVVTNSEPFQNIPNYPELATILEEVRGLPNHRLIDAAALAKKAGSPRAANMVMLGAGSPYLELPEEALISGIETVFAGKAPEIIETNVTAYRLGRDAVTSSGGTP